MLKVLRTPNALINLQSKVKFPEKFKGTIIEKWANYWKNLFIDYRQMLQDLRSDMQEDPKKALKWTAGIVTLGALAKNNPNELDFKDNMKRITNEVILVSEECRHPKSVEHLQYLQQCYNEGVIKYTTLGIVSFMYTSSLKDSCDLYKAHCSYLKPSYFSIFSRIVDVGFMGKWWNLHIKTTNYDVNE
ncbi:mitochondrial import inner membrane translocase subunit Tim29 [Bicyclus anynana]|uniref:Mitochondrial import inner membrane translocase subunit Tim29 n=1 Tax=Bicyclus anynana TaxID=110368 RepID=A0A6J1MX82_BICAN|nr:mitochondrial import inner membrane translocase subunit Tim29 [Bicyclus anynana]